VPINARFYNQNGNLTISLSDKIQIYLKLLSGSCKNRKNPLWVQFLFKIPTLDPALAEIVDSGLSPLGSVTTSGCSGFADGDATFDVLRSVYMFS